MENEASSPVSIYTKLFVCLSDINSVTPGPICLKFWLGNSGDPRECSLAWFKILSWMGQLLSKKRAKIVIYDKGRVNVGFPASCK